MGPDIDLARKSLRPLAERRRLARRARRRWRLPIAYRAIPIIALAIDLAIIVISAIGAELLYHELPSELEGEFSHTLAAAVFVAILFVATMRIQKLYTPVRLVEIDDQARSVLSAWCGAFSFSPAACSPRASATTCRAETSFSSGRSGRWRCWRIGRRGGQFSPGRSKAARCAAGQSFPSPARTWFPSGSSTTSAGTATTSRSFPCPGGRTVLGRGDRRSGLDVPGLQSRGGAALRRPGAHDQSSPLAKRLRVLPIPVTMVPFGPLAQLFQRNHSDIGETVAIELQRAALSPAEQWVKRSMDIVVALATLVVLAPLMIAVAIAIKLDSRGRSSFARPGTASTAGPSPSTSFVR